MGRSGGTSTTVTQAADPWYRGQLEGLYNTGADFLAQNPYQAYGGGRVAPFQPLQMAAQDFLSQGLLGRSYPYQSPAFGGGGGGYPSPFNFQPSNFFPVVEGNDSGQYGGYDVGGGQYLGGGPTGNDPPSTGPGGYVYGEGVDPRTIPIDTSGMTFDPTTGNWTFTTTPDVSIDQESAQALGMTLEEYYAARGGGPQAASSLIQGAPTAGLTLAPDSYPGPTAAPAPTGGSYNLQSGEGLNQFFADYGLPSEYGAPGYVIPKGLVAGTGGGINNELNLGVMNERYNPQGFAVGMVPSDDPNERRLNVYRQGDPNPINSFDPNDTGGLRTFMKEVTGIDQPLPFQTQEDIDRAVASAQPGPVTQPPAPPPPPLPNFLPPPAGGGGGGAPPPSGFGFSPSGYAPPTGFGPGTGLAEAGAAAQVAGGIAGSGAYPLVGTGDLRQGIGLYQNPYESQVVNRALSDLERARQVAVQGDRSQATLAGAFGGNRSAILEAETNRAYADAQARTAGQLRQQGFDRAAGLAESDANRLLSAGLANQGGFFQGRGQQLQGAGLLSGIGGDIFGRTLGTANALSAAGAEQQAQAQNLIGSDLAQFYEAQNDPYRRFGFLQSLLTGVPFDTTTTQTLPGGSRAGGFLGGAATGAGIGSMFAPGLGTGIGAGIGGLLGLFS